jgi:hypothetical protein
VLFTASGRRVSTGASLEPFVVGGASGLAISALASSDLTASAVPPTALESSPSSFRTLSRAGRFASGWSVGAEGEDGSSRGRLVDGMAIVEIGDDDIAEISGAVAVCGDA